MAAFRSLTAREIAKLVGGEVDGPADITIAGVAPLERARPGDLSLLVSTRYLQYFQRTSAGAVLLSPDLRNVSGVKTGELVPRKRDVTRERPAAPRRTKKIGRASCRERV